MKKILLAAFISVASLCGINALPAAAQDDVVTTTQEAVVSDGSGTAIEISSTTAQTEETADNGSKPAKIKKKLTPEERNKKIKDADSTGIGITLMSMCIVIMALIILSILFLAFGKISQKLHTKKKMETYGLSHDDANHEASSGECIAAIAAALHEHFNARHDIEDTVLTMRKLKRAYSPWSSKLYGLRQVPARDVWHR